MGETIQRGFQVRREDLKLLKCSNPECPSTTFIQIFELGIYSGLINPTGQDQLVQMPKIVCIKCGSPPGKPEEVKEESNVITLN
jgi:hypothetical protein